MEDPIETKAAQKKKGEILLKKKRETESISQLRQNSFIALSKHRKTTSPVEVDQKNETSREKKKKKTYRRPMQKPLKQKEGNKVKGGGGMGS